MSLQLGVLNEEFAIAMHATEHFGRNGHIELKLARLYLIANYKYLILKYFG